MRRADRVARPSRAARCDRPASVPTESQCASVCRARSRTTSSASRSPRHGVRELSVAGHEVLVQTGPGSDRRSPTTSSSAPGPRSSPDADTDLGRGRDGPQGQGTHRAEEYHRLRDDLVLFTYLHLAADRPLTERLVDAGTTAIAYETVVGARRRRCRCSRRCPRWRDGWRRRSGPPQPRTGTRAAAASCSAACPASRPRTSSSSAPGRPGATPRWLAAGMEASVTVLDLDVGKLRYIDSVAQGSRSAPSMSNRLTLEEEIARPTS